jgi:hypothetical protein
MRLSSQNVSASLVCAMALCLSATAWGQTQVPLAGSSGIPTAVPETPAQIDEACGLIPPVPGIASPEAVNAQTRGQGAFGNHLYAQAAAELWIAFALHPALGRLNEFSQALAGMEDAGRPRLCAALTCLERRYAGDSSERTARQRQDVQGRLRLANCGGSSSVSLGPVATARFQLTAEERAAYADSVFLQEHAQRENALVVVGVDNWSLPINYRTDETLLPQALRLYRAAQRTRVTRPSTDPPRRPLAAWVAIAGSGALALGGGLTFVIEGIRCGESNQPLDAALAGQRLGWSRVDAAAAQNHCTGANVGAAVAGVGLVAAVVTFVLTMPATPPTARPGTPTVPRQSAFLRLIPTLDVGPAGGTVGFIGTF